MNTETWNAKRTIAAARAAAQNAKVTTLWFDKTGEDRAEAAAKDWCGGLKERKPWVRIYTATFQTVHTQERNAMLHLGRAWGVSDLNGLLRLWPRKDSLATFRRYGCMTLSDIEAREKAIQRFEWQANAIEDRIEALMDARNFDRVLSLLARVSPVAAQKVVESQLTAALI